MPDDLSRISYLEHRLMQIKAVMFHNDASSPLSTTVEKPVDVASIANYLAIQPNDINIFENVDEPREQYPFPISTAPPVPQPSQLPGSGQGNNGKTVYILLPVFVILSTLLVLLIVFLIGIICSKRRKGIRLVEDGGPLDLSRNDGVIGEGGIEGVESRWLEQVSEDVREGYKRGKGKFACFFSANVVLIRIHHRLPAAIPTLFHCDGHYPFTIPLYPRKRRLCMVLRTRLRIQSVHVCRVSN